MVYKNNGIRWRLFLGVRTEEGSIFGSQHNPD